MAHLALKGIHGLKLLGLARRAEACNCLVSEVLKIRLTIGTEARDIQHESRALTGFGLNSKARQFLKGIDNFTVFANQMIQGGWIFRNDFY